MHRLDRPMWSALTGRQADFAVGSGGARRYQTDVSILAGIRDQSDAALDDLAALLPDEGHIFVAQNWDMRCPTGARIVDEKLAFQLVFEGQGTAQSHDHAIISLTKADWPDMLALATATEPGPFLHRTPALGGFWGVRREGRLIAMAGERMRQEGFSEISAICTDPAYRGRGLGKALTTHVRDRIIARGDHPYLHAFTTNTAAVALYEKLGFKKRTTLFPKVFEKAA